MAGTTAWARVKAFLAGPAGVAGDDTIRVRAFAAVLFDLCERSGAAQGGGGALWGRLWGWLFLSCRKNV